MRYEEYQGVTKKKSGRARSLNQYRSKQCGYVCVLHTECLSEVCCGRLNGVKVKKKKKEEKLKLVVVQLDGSLIFEILANEHGIGRNAVF